MCDLEYLEKLLQDKKIESELREKYPLLKEAWDRYQNLLNVYSNKFGDEIRKEISKESS
ncbi:MAG: tRNA lysidine(34) synthetase TilS [Candidimonas sp.]